MRVLVVNAGSSSLKLSLLAGSDGSWATSASGDDLDAMLGSLPAPPDAVGHRFVHGGPRTAAVMVDPSVTEELAALTPLAPLHQPPALTAVARCEQALPGVPQVACFDTAFHTSLPPAASTYAVPARFRDVLRVRGFHGLSYAWSARRVAELLPTARRVVVAHLGAGASLAALFDGRSVHTTMGATPLDGLVMASRPGALDPGGVAWLAARPDVDLEDVLWRESGLLALAGTGDMRELLARRSRGDERARAALAVWSHRLLVQAGGCAAVLGGLDALVFTGGIGEHAPSLRAELCRDLAYLGVDGIADEPDGDGFVSAPGAAVPVLVVHAREDVQVAEEVAGLLG